MGGTWRKTLSRFTVEQCRVLSAATLMREGRLRPNFRASYAITWGIGELQTNIGCEVTTGVDAGTLTLCYRRLCDGEVLNYIVRLTTTPLPWGGRKWWFVCPLTKHDVPCRRRVGKLYLLGRYFACRHCHELTYQSCQESHRRQRIIR